MKLGIRYKLIVVQGLGLAFFILLAALSYYSITSYSSIHNRDIDLAYRMELVADLQLLFERSLMPPNDYLITGDIKEREHFAEIVLDMAKLFEKVMSEENRPEEEVRIGNELRKEIIDHEKMAMLLLSISDPVGNEGSAKLMKGLDANGTLLVKKAEKLHELIRLELEEHSNNVSRIGDRITKLFAVVFFIFLGGMIYLIFMVRRSVSRPLDELTNAASIIAQGDLDYRVDIKTGDEIESLGNEFNTMAKSLKEKSTETREYVNKLERSNYLLDQNILRLYTLYNVSKTLATTVEAEKLLEHIVTEVQQSLKIHRITVMLVDKEHDIITIAAGVGLSSEARAATFRLQDGLYGWAAMTGESSIVTDPSGDPKFVPTEGLDDDASSIIVAPFKSRGKVIGILTAYKLREEPFDRQSFEMLTTIATQLALTIDNARLFEETINLAITDGMTSLYNYRHFKECIADEFTRSKRYKRALSLIMVDVDHFKKFNDTYGHQTGDDVLRGVAKILKQSVRSSDIVARYGGEEFVILLPETGKSDAFILAERVRNGIESADLSVDTSSSFDGVTVSLGVSAIEEGTEDFKELIKKADSALYQAKENGRNRVN